MNDNGNLLDVNVVYTEKVNYAMVSNGMRCIREIRLTNNGTETLRNRTWC